MQELKDKAMALAKGQMRSSPKIKENPFAKQDKPDCLTDLAITKRGKKYYQDFLEIEDDLYIPETLSQFPLSVVNRVH
jgi:hypothetical protein